jgi:solute carrier family 8 (sodium/calcium exchanger)
LYWDFFLDFFYVTLSSSGDGDDDGEEGEEGGGGADESSPSCMDYIMHFLTLFWKILFAFIPPTGKKD